MTDAYALMADTTLGRRVFNHVVPRSRGEVCPPPCNCSKPSMSFRHSSAWIPTGMELTNDRESDDGYASKLKSANFGIHWVVTVWVFFCLVDFDLWKLRS